MRRNLPITDVEYKFADTANILSTTGLQGRISHINEDFIEISGFTKEELIGQNHHIATSVQRQTRVSQSIAGGITEIKVRSEENLEAAKLSGKVSDKTVNIIRRLDQLTSQFWDNQQQRKTSS